MRAHLKQAQFLEEFKTLGDDGQPKLESDSEGEEYAIVATGNYEEREPTKYLEMLVQLGKEGFSTGKLIEMTKKSISQMIQN